MNISLLISAFLIGLGSSLHCVGMCSPLQFAVLLQKEDKQLNVMNWIIYQAARISVYGIYGMVFGWIGSSFKWFGIQQNISLLLGICILSTILLIQLFPSFESTLTNNVISTWLRKKISPFIFSDSISSKILAGILNGILPCGMVYVALAGATATQSGFQGVIFMVAFGIGTLPLLLTTTVMGKYVQSTIKNYFSKWHAYMIGLIAIMLIVRGLNMGNLLSPSIIHGSETTLQCSTR